MDIASDLDPARRVLMHVDPPGLQMFRNAVNQVRGMPARRPPAMPVDPYFLGGSDGGEYQGETPCPDCGYDLRGLSIGPRCSNAAPLLSDPVLDEPPETMIDPSSADPDGSDPGLPDGGDARRRRDAGAGNAATTPQPSRPESLPECGIDRRRRERIAVRSDPIPEDV